MASPEASVPTGSPRENPPRVPRRRLPAWAITIPLLCLAAYGGYRLGQPTASPQAGGGFGQSQGQGGQGQGGQGGGAGRTGAGSQAGTGQAAAGQAAAAQADAGATAGTGRAGGAQAGAGQTGAGQTGSRQGAQGQSGQGQAGADQAGGGQARTGQAAGRQGQSRQGAGEGGAGGGGVTVPVTTVTVKAGTLTTSRSNTGTVAPAQTATVNSRSSGTVSTINAQVGQDVKAAQTVVLLSNPDLNASVQSAQNALQSAQAQLDNQTSTLADNRTQLNQAVTSAQLSLGNAQKTYAGQKALFDVGALARTALDAQNLAVQQAQGNLVTAQANLNANATARTTGLRNLQISVDNARISLSQAQAAATNVKITAPFDGQLTALPVTGGEYLNAGTPAFSLVSSARTLTFNVPPAEAASLTVGRQLSFVAGQSTYVIKVAQNPGAPTGGTVPITARFIGDSLPALGTVGSVQYASRVGTGTLIPSTALKSDNNQSLVYLLKGGKARLQNVTVIGQADGQAVVSGLDAGVQVVDQPPAGLIDGANVSTGAAGGQDQGGGFGGGR
ncbi:efflux RND transporter periplasmic adaptor subunit [Deinococcus arenicola]|uniref:Efflux RND transporter periplasmic adaptor subunit n=1 Tax=Deinococcus arenicola TaxID=2994950 RepID=A0ABU4DMK5_9DEIO|nr:efflux RND transporter periplasmic adaptor subunit [Deinococcus sp. ZS9-10]MDV6373677.1 efflux RND transporter periplasmic adaptor subunit [Deinococcus sp. ZS9-10]